MKTSNVKDWLSTICAIIIAVCGAGTGVLWTSGVVLPTWLTTLAITLAGIAVVVKGYLVGKNPDGKTKTPDQVNSLNVGK